METLKEHLARIEGARLGSEPGTWQLLSALRVAADQIAALQRRVELLESAHPRVITVDIPDEDVEAFVEQFREAWDVATADARAGGLPLLISTEPAVEMGEDPVADMLAALEVWNLLKQTGRLWMHPGSGSNVEALPDDTVLRFSQLLHWDRDLIGRVHRWASWVLDPDASILLVPLEVQPYLKPDQEPVTWPSRETATLGGVVEEPPRGVDLPMVDASVPWPPGVSSGVGVGVVDNATMPESSDVPAWVAEDRVPPPPPLVEPRPAPPTLSNPLAPVLDGPLPAFPIPVVGADRSPVPPEDESRPWDHAIRWESDPVDHPLPLSDVMCAQLNQSQTDFLLDQVRVVGFCPASEHVLMVMPTGSDVARLVADEYVSLDAGMIKLRFGWIRPYLLATLPEHDGW